MKNLMLINLKIQIKWTSSLIKIQFTKTYTRRNTQNSPITIKEIESII